MSQASSDQLKLINAGGALARLLLVVLVVLVCYGSWNAASWYAGSEMALVAQQIPDEPMGTARMAVHFSPADPLAHWSLATIEQKDISPERARAAIPEYERAVSLSPHDFRLWVDLGRAREHVGDFEDSEKALRRGVELAPYYAWPRWHLGNFLVRRGRYQEGLAELRPVAETDPTKRGAIFDLAWYIYGGDSKAVNHALGDSPLLRAGFINYLLSRQRLGEALEIWSSLNSAEKKESSDVGSSLIQHLLAAKRFRTAAALTRDFADGSASAEVGKISNESFESPVAQDGAGFFDWHVPSVPQAQAALDPTGAHGGSLSLRINFNAQATLDLNITQLVAVEPGTQYRLLFYVRTNNLKSAAMPVVQVLTTDGKGLANSPPVAPGTSDWQQVALDFKTPPDVDGITVRILRAPCAMEGAVCPIFGTVWYDDFNLQRIGREAGARTADRSN